MLYTYISQQVVGKIYILFTLWNYCLADFEQPSFKWPILKHLIPNMKSGGAVKEKNKKIKKTVLHCLVHVVLYLRSHSKECHLSPQEQQQQQQEQE